ncbi:hypothetical protein [Nonomuraea turkmeniaca]|nr:hypothetical protein [Nonomuraea turkmeniaca]
MSCADGELSSAGPDINNSGDAWENQAVFDQNGRVNPNIRWLP